MPIERAIIVGSGPNGLTAGIVLARAGWQVTVYEAANTIGGGARTAEITLPGFRHDTCSAVHPMAASSPFFAKLPLQEWGVEWLQPEFALAHPFDTGQSAILTASFSQVAETVGIDGTAWRSLMEPFATRWARLSESILGPIRVPRHPLLMARFGAKAIFSATRLARDHFRGPEAAALFAGIAAHSMIPLERMASSAIGLALGAAGHAVGWPIPRGGSGRISDALASCLRHHGGEIITGHEVEDVDALPPDADIIFDVTPRQLLRIAGHRLPGHYTRALRRYRYGVGVFKIDYALSEPVPWRAEGCRRAGTVHVGGTLEEIADAERACWEGRTTQRPFVLVTQPCVVDDTRAPGGRHTLWAYCHVPHGSGVDMTEWIENQLERFAPGFRDTILARSTMTAAQVEANNANYIGGDINGGVLDLWGIVARPAFRWNPYATPNKRIFICSSSTPPGGGVHGMCGYHAARAILR